jgi:hypothetical protein
LTETPPSTPVSKARLYNRRKLIHEGALAIKLIGRSSRVRSSTLDSPVSTGRENKDRHMGHHPSCKFEIGRLRNTNMTSLVNPDSVRPHSGGLALIASQMT